MAIIGLGFLKNLQRAWFQAVGGQANGTLVSTTMLIGTDGNPYNATGGGGGGSNVVWGPDADGTPPTEPPIQIAGFDGTNVQSLAVTNAGNVKSSAYDSANNAITSQTLGATPAAGNRGFVSVSINHAQFNDAGFGAPTEGLWYDLRLTRDRSLIVANRATTGTNTQVAGTTTANTPILAANNARKGATISNDNTGQTLYLSLGVVCTATNYTVILKPGDYYEVPFGYIGAISGVFSASTGFALITELI